MAAKGTDTINLKYDPAGNRVFKGSSVNGNRKYIIDISGQLPTILLELDPGDWLKVSKTYMYANGEILMQYNGNHKADKYFYLHDRRGSVRQLIGANGSVVRHYTYDPFAKTIEESSAGSQAPSNAFRFTGQYYDSEIGQYYLRARQYDPQLMRFSGRDPVFGQFEEPITLHKYLYCGNEPVNRIDPVGLWSTPVHNAIIDLAFGGNNSWGQLQTYDIKRGSAWVDSPQFQDSAHAYMHAMIPAEWGREPDPLYRGIGVGDDRRVLRPSMSKQTASELMVRFVISELEQYNCNTERGYIREAGFNLGAAAHPLMDYMCPAHDFRMWGGELDEYAPHARYDRKIEDSELRDTATFTRTTLEMLNNDVQALSGWDW